MIVTIDGPAGTGKSTVAKKLAEVLGFSYFDTGALYRALCFKILEEKIDLSDKKSFAQILETFVFQIRIQEGQEHYFVGEMDVTKAIRSPQVTQIVSKISAMKIVRDAMYPFQKEFAQTGNSVFEGRDMGTKIFPKADFKFFLTARIEVRAKRRFKELQETLNQKNSTFAYENILKEIKERDAFDSQRAASPLKQAADACFVDTSDLSIEEVVSLLIHHIKTKK